jgi:hypothetical protein
MTNICPPCSKQGKWQREVSYLNSQLDATYDYPCVTYHLYHLPPLSPLPIIPICGMYQYKYHCVCGYIGHIWLHDYLVNLDSWLMPLVIILVIVNFGINHVTFIMTMTFIITLGKYNQIIGVYWLMKCRHMFKHNKTTLIM